MWKGKRAMTKRLEIYKCDVCGNIVEMFHAGAGTMVCCGQPMTLQAENTVDAAKEKHVPVVEKVDGGLKVKIGSVAHPMQKEHFIEWIEIIAGDKVCREHLNPGQAPEATFKTGALSVTAREYCNLHGLWKA
jgi:superoxide reductase